MKVTSTPMNVTIKNVLVFSSTKQARPQLVDIHVYQKNWRDKWAIPNGRTIKAHYTFWGTTSKGTPVTAYFVPSDKCDLSKLTWEISGGAQIPEDSIMEQFSWNAESVRVK